MKPIIVIGAGGYAKSILDSLNYVEYKIYGFVDEFKMGEHLGYKILSYKVENIENYHKYFYFIAIGDNKRRTQWYNKIKLLGCELINIKDPSAIVSRNIDIGEGVFIGKMAIVNSGVSIGNNCIINTKALIEHGCTIERDCNIATNAVINGDVYVQKGAFIGSCSVINGQKTIGENSIIGSGAVIIRDVDPNCVVAGVPGKVLKRLSDIERE